MNSKLLPTVGISCGDPNGIGIEVILKSLKDPTCLDLVTPVIYCNYKLIDYQNKFYGLDLKLQKLEPDSEFIPNKINVVNTHDNNFTIDFGKLTLNKLSFCCDASLSQSPNLLSSISFASSRLMLPTIK